MVYLVLYTVRYRLELGVSRGLGSVREDGGGLFSIVCNVTGWSWECLEDWGLFRKTAVVYLVLYTVYYRLELGVSR